MDKCELCIGKDLCINRHLLSAWCKDKNKFRIFAKTYEESKKIIHNSQDKK